MKLRDVLEGLKEIDGETLVVLARRIIEARATRDEEQALSDRRFDRKSLRISEARVAASNRIAAALEQLANVRVDIGYGTSKNAYGQTTIQVQVYPSIKP